MKKIISMLLASCSISVFADVGSVPTNIPNVDLKLYKMLTLENKDPTQSIKYKIAILDKSIPYKDGYLDRLYMGYVSEVSTCYNLATHESKCIDKKYTFNQIPVTRDARSFYTEIHLDLGDNVNLKSIFCPNGGLICHDAFDEDQSNVHHMVSWFTINNVELPSYFPKPQYYLDYQK